jgi:hypothetical protein
MLSNKGISHYLKMPVRKELEACVCLRPSRLFRSICVSQNGQMRSHGDTLRFTVKARAMVKAFLIPFFVINETHANTNYKNLPTFSSNVKI